MSNLNPNQFGDSKVSQFEKWAAKNPFSAYAVLDNIQVHKPFPDAILFKPEIMESHKKNRPKD